MRRELYRRQVLHRRALHGYDENFSSKNYKEFFIDLAMKFEDLMNEITLSNGIVFYSIYVLKYPAGLQYPDDNAQISRFIEKLMQYYQGRRRYPKDVWIRERSMTGHHYHLLFLVDSKVITKSASILKKATEIWQDCLGIEDAQGLVHLSTTIGEGGSSTGFKMIGNGGFLSSYFTTIIRVARHYAECDDKGKLPVPVAEY